MLTFISGGVRSGKSALAEELSLQLAHSAGRLFYVATSMQTDAEMSERVKHHQERRDESNRQWHTIEFPNTGSHQLDRFIKEDTILLDCLTNLLSNELFAGWEQGSSMWLEANYRRQVHDRILLAVETLCANAGNVIVVSNELFSDIPANDEGTAYFLELLGELHQAIVAQADKAILVENGIPIMKKGGSM